MMIRSRNQLLTMAADALCAALAIWLAYAVRYAQWLPDVPSFALLVPAAVAVLVGTFAVTGVYQLVVRHLNPIELWPILRGYTIAGVLLFVIAFVARQSDLPRSAPFLFIAIGVLLSSSLRLTAQYMLGRAHRSAADGKPTVIYGAGVHGVQLAAMLRQGHLYKPVAFIDDDRRLHGRRIHGCRVYGPDQLSAVLEKTSASHIVVAAPPDWRKERLQMLQRLSGVEAHVLLPSTNMSDQGEALDGALREVQIADLLDREPASMDVSRVSDSLRGKVVLVTGAGGSIGSEVCRQLILCRIDKLVLLDHSEFALWSIHRELGRNHATALYRPTLVPVLGDAGDALLLEDTLRRFSVDYVYHAAAYKHVSMLQDNLIAAIRNNTLATTTAGQVADKVGIAGFLLVSTDKAVNPTSSLGVSKLLAEYALRCIAASASSGCCFSIVRFGNVLGSSGSVVPLFAQQIDEGEPLAVTHPQATRYLMTIPEAAQLIIEASLFAKQAQAQTYALEMGDPVLITDLARKLARLKQHAIGSGGSAGVEFEFTGLREGEKLHEELSHDGAFAPTAHSHIHRIDESEPDAHLISELFVQLKAAVAAYDEVKVRELLQPHLLAEPNHEPLEQSSI